MKILISDAFGPDLPDRLARFGEVTDDKDQLPTATVVLVRSKTKCTPEYIDSAPALRMIIRGGVGLDNIDLDYARQRGVIVHNTAAASSIAVAELGMALMLAMPCHVIRGHQTMAEGVWAKKELKRTELYGKTLGLLGAGRIATELGRRAAAFGMEIIAFDPYVEQHELATLVPDAGTLFERADYISIHTPLTPETRGMIDAEAIGRMKDGVRLVNTARAAVVDDAAMRDALVSGKVAGYATDVWPSDPPEDSPLVDAPNMVMAPHIGASTRENMGRIADVIVELIEEFQASTG